MRLLPALFPLLLLVSPVRSWGAADDWKIAANQRIEQIRKGDARILIVDGLGRGVGGIGVRARQIDHRFAFGSVVNLNLVFDERYRDFFLDHFEWAVFENETKWFFNEPNRDYVTYSKADAIYEVCAEHGIKVRGHCVFWAKEEYTPWWLRSDPPELLRKEVDERLDSAVPHFAGRFLHWDVNNEMLDGDFFRRKLGPEIEPYMFSRAHALDPAALLFVNDYSTVECCPSRTEALINQVNSLMARGAPIHGIGVQGHYWGPTVDPVATLQGLDRLATLDRPIWITEYDTVNPDEHARAEALENLYRAAFSHPAVEGILMWGFWAGSHWRGADAAIVNLDWTINAAGVRYEALQEEWTTDLSAPTGPDGVFAFRGFHGTYTINAQMPGGPRRARLNLEPGSGLVQLTLPLDPEGCLAAEEVAGVAGTREPGSGTLRLSWPLPSSGMEAVYDTLRSTDPGDFQGAALCLETDGEDRLTLDPDIPAAGTAFFYQVRAQNRCPSGEGPLGTDSGGTPRPARPCS